VSIKLNHLDHAETFVETFEGSFFLQRSSWEISPDDLPFSEQRKGTFEDRKRIFDHGELATRGMAIKPWSMTNNRFFLSVSTCLYYQTS
jgi:hypothetical protein